MEKGEVSFSNEVLTERDLTPLHKLITRQVKVSNVKKLRQYLLDFIPWLSYSDEELDSYFIGRYWYRDDNPILNSLDEADLKKLSLLFTLEESVDYLRETAGSPTMVRLVPLLLENFYYFLTPYDMEDFLSKFEGGTLIEIKRLLTVI